MNRIIAITDIHGCYNTMVDLFNKLDIDFCQDKVVFLGDYIDRGIYPVKVLKVIKELQEKHPNNVIALKGNHEDMAVRYCFDNNPCWSWNGYETTYNDLEELPEWEKMDLLLWMKRIPLRYATDKYRFCHSGYWYEEINEYGYDMVLWDRDWINYGYKNSNGDKTIIFGHTPHGMPKWYDNSLCIDTGVCFGGMLTAAVIEGDDVTTVSVEVNENDK